MSLTQANANYVIDETVGALAFDEFAQASPMMPALFGQRSSMKPDEESGSISGLGDFQSRVEFEEPNEDQPIQQFRKKFSHAEYDLQVKIERKVIDDSRFEFFGSMGRKIGESAVRTFESQGAAVFNNAFTTSLSEDGLSICNATHLNVDSANSQSNAGSTALSFDSVGTTRQLMRAYTDYRGNVIQVVPDMLIVPNELEQTGWEIIRSSGDPTEANLKANFHNGRYALAVWDYLTDANNWFMADSRLMAQNLLWYWRIPLEMFGDGSLMKGMRQIAGYFRGSKGAIDWRWVYGHNVA